jgi:hypothetical protein
MDMYRVTKERHGLAHTYCSMPSACGDKQSVHVSLQSKLYSTRLRIRQALSHKIILRHALNNPTLRTSCGLFAHSAIFPRKIKRIEGLPVLALRAPSCSRGRAVSHNQLQVYTRDLLCIWCALAQAHPQCAHQLKRGLCLMLNDILQSNAHFRAAEPFCNDAGVACIADCSGLGKMNKVCLRQTCQNRRTRFCPWHRCVACFSLRLFVPPFRRTLPAQA